MGELAPTLSKEEWSRNLAQEISQRGDEIPERFIVKDGFPEATDAPDKLWRETLLIDFSLLSSSNHDELAKLRSALSHWGCFQVINHGMEKAFLEELIEVSKQFFELPLEEKLKYTIPGGSNFQGFGGNLTNWNDRLYLTLLPEDSRKPQLWPQKPEKLSEMVDEYAKKLEMVIEGIYKAMARSLNLEEDSFLKQMDQSSIHGKLTIYPRCSCPERVLGVRPHSDWATLAAVLAEPGVDGLQVEKDDQWFKVPVIPGALFLNLGDLGVVISNGIFKSVRHRVVTNFDKDRTSWAAFSAPRDDIQIGPISELIDADRPQSYIKFTMAELRPTFTENFKIGRDMLDSLKL